jgi:cysteinyl-tRNA synthetase
LGINLADSEPRATDNIPEMIAHIQVLIAKGAAYSSNGDVYFAVRKFKEYGKLSGQSIEKMLEGVRIDPNEKKEDPLDFALWKKSAADEPGWDSPWGRGRPGWHIECTCMSMKYLKCETLDIHAGGRDLIFPHHENEIAQAEAATHKPFAKYWIHHGLLTINAQKMSKSLGNFITIQDALKKHHVNDLKMFFLFSHYASPIDYSDKKMEEAHKAVQKFDILFWKASEILKGKQPLPIKMDFIDKHKTAFLDAMDDDFNTPQSLASLFNLINDTNKFIDEGKKDSQYEGVIYHAVDILENLARNILGLFTNEVHQELNAVQSQLIEERKNARLKKDFKKSDELRDALKQHGIVVEDTKDGQTWRWA